MQIHPIGRILGDALTLPLRVGQKVAAPGIAVAEEVAHHVPQRVLDLHFGSDEVDHHQVVYDFFSGIEPEIRNPGGSLPGANRWDTPPGATHRYPVILVHGTGGGAQSNWGTYVPLLVGEGFSVFTLTYGAVAGAAWPMSALGGMNRIEDSAAEFGAFAQKVLDATGADKIDVVGHSQGTIVPDYWAKFLGGADKIRKYVSLAPLWQGTTAFSHTHEIFHFLNLRFGLDPSTLIPCYSALQMAAGSDFITTLNSDGGPYLPGIEYTNISTEHDEFVRPYTSGQLPGPPGTSVTNIVVQDGCRTDFSDHLAICGSKRAAALVLNALDDHADHVVPCDVVPPFFGSGPIGRVGGAPALIEPFAVGLDEDGASPSVHGADHDADRDLSTEDTTNDERGQR
ncbi:esterase/lipase family protein [Gordonia insulae]|uniref:Lipase EstA n=1 Tax=Gordonia insulae TaxID=2420509 RepID=A0A3G8JH96_9ACTN|nr:alpha/beta fold hydrolase [Gordonia insulae]AZG43630.1 Lipase EstA [Gordonia insulae]